MVWYGPTSETVIGVAKGGQRGLGLQRLENIVILCFERRFSKENSVVRLELNILAHQIFGLETPLQTVWMQRRQKNWLKYTDLTELTKITSRICQNFSNYSSLFSSPSSFVAVRFVSLKKCPVKCTSLLLILLLTS